MPRVIVGIHGLANKSEKQTLARWWKASILEGLAKNRGLKDVRFKFHMVHWADLLYKYPLHSDESFSFDSLFNNEPYVPAGPKSLKRYDKRWWDRLGGHAKEVLGRGVDGLKKTVGLHQVADFIIQRKLKDLYFYWDGKQKIRDRKKKMRVAGKVLDEECKNALMSFKDHDIMLIAHSMGSIISYNVLRDRGRSDKGLRILLYVTIGSPLGLSIVKDRIRRLRWDKKVRTPSIVNGRWVNFADKEDPVAFDYHLRDDFGENRHGIRVEDDLVLNDYQINDDHNHHKSYGYLRTPEMSELVAVFLGK